MSDEPRCKKCFDTGKIKQFLWGLKSLVAGPYRYQKCDCKTARTNKESSEEFMSDNKYPYIGKGIESGNVVLFFDKNNGECIEGQTCSTEMTGQWNEGAFSNITREYLSNTCGEVKNKRHAGLIKALAENAGCATDDYNHDDKYFSVEGDYLRFWGGKNYATDYAEREVTIPEPPEGWNVAHCNGQTEGRKEALDNNEEWPCVGDESVLVSMGMTEFNRKVLITYIGKGVGCYKDLSNDMEYTFSSRETVFQKPKTPEQELRDDIFDIILRSSADFATKTLLEKYTITKKEK